MTRRRTGGIGIAVLALLATVLTGPPAAAGPTATGPDAAPVAVGSGGLVPHALPVDHIGGKVWGPATDGQTGDGAPFDTVVPVNYAGLTSGIRQISTDGLHTLALRSDGIVLSSGYNGYGEIGDGALVERLTAVPVINLTGAVQVVAAERFSLALRSDGTVWAWGANYHGQLGDGTGVDRLSPVQVAGLTGIVQIAAGDGDAAFALRSDGSVWAWGYNVLGQIGDGTTATRYSPVLVTGLTAVQQISSSGWTSLALRADGTVWAWGDNEEGGLGDGTTIDRHTPVPVPGLTGVRQVAAGAHCVAVLNDGTVLGWGFNDRGQLGNGTVGADQLTPIVLPGLTGITQVSVGSYHGLARRSDGTAMAWGWNARGQLGDGTVTDHPAPEVIPNLSHVTSVDAGWSSAAIVALPYFGVTTTPNRGTVHAGGLVTTQVKVTAFNGFTATAAMSASGLPAGTTATFSPAKIGPTKPGTLTLRTSLGTPAGTYTVVVTATSPSSAEPVKTTGFLLTVGPPADFSVSLSEPFGQVGGGASISTLIQLNPINGFAETVSVGGVIKPPPVGLTISLSAAHAGVSTPVTMTVSTTFDTPPGTYLITVSALADDPLVRTLRSAIYQLTVGPPIG